MDVTITVPPGELIDKITILEIKQAWIKDPAKLSNINHEFAVLAAVMAGAIVVTPEITALRAELKTENEAIWQAEEDLRALERRKDFGPAFIAAARSVYHHNDRRAELKRRLNSLLGSRIVE